MRASSGISSPCMPDGWPRPSQYSSSAHTASALASGNPRLRTIAAPRSQRVSTIALPSATSERSTESVRWARAMRPPAATCCEV